MDRLPVRSEAVWRTFLRLARRAGGDKPRALLRRCRRVVNEAVQKRLHRRIDLSALDESVGVFLDPPSRLCNGVLKRGQTSGGVCKRGQLLSNCLYSTSL